MKRIQGRPRLRMVTWAEAHLRASLSSLGELVRGPGASLMAIAIIGVALALPLGLYVLMENAARISGGWQDPSRLSLFLSPNVEDQRAVSLAETLAAEPNIQDVQVISRQQALEEYRQLSGFGPALKALGENPLPAVLVVRPAADLRLAQNRTLRDRLAALPEVHVAKLDMQWIERLQAILAIVKRAVLVLAVLLAGAVTLIVGNTIRTSIHGQRERIAIAQLFGATDGFISRPFLYRGLFYGLGGGLLAWGLVELTFGLLDGPVARLAALYLSDYRLSTVTFGALLVVLAGSAGLGICGSWLTVAHYLRSDPNVR